MAKKIVIKAGTANGWSEKQREVINKIEWLLKEDPNTKVTDRSLGNCWGERTLDNGEFSLTYDVDSSD